LLSSALHLAFELLIMDLKIGESGKGETDSEMQSLIRHHWGKQKRKMRRTMAILSFVTCHKLTRKVGVYR
jgi:hypothetical protein